MPQMMPIKWFMIYFIYLIVFYMFIMLMNSFLIKFNLKFKKTSKSLKKWNWLW
ncbi:ATP synthase F0 subunit 8 (mitochondrion) [Apis florea]|uniref:ATP synthase F0 subunit 8 n=1 Tax=Apis florea TaxID=7463 RepID=R4IQU3_APIFL|nr:ATP synthase F0 subunit 8 [Apis florea]AFZ41101.1 ATP synthase F0 subunit 8 [Apis florea]AGC38382.1 ATP synthase F0 subunit 8 [Apis florea]BBC54810.1 ATP synthase F0 subunit 8 [Apis florea]